jgi:hypothetical protein
VNGSVGWRINTALKKYAAFNPIDIGAPGRGSRVGQDCKRKVGSALVVSFRRQANHYQAASPLKTSLSIKFNAMNFSMGC